jgi:hypothetical protein
MHAIGVIDRRAIEDAKQVERAGQPQSKPHV